MLSLKQNLDSFDYVGTKRNLNNYFEDLEELKLEQARLNAQKGLTANYDISVESKNQPYVRIGKDVFNLSALEDKNGEIKNHLLGFRWAKSILSDEEQIYLMEYFINQKYEDEIVDLLGFSNSDSKGFKKLKRSAIYKFADFLNLIVESN